MKFGIFILLFIFTHTAFACIEEPTNVYLDKVKLKAIVSVTDSFNIISSQKLVFTYPKQISIKEGKQKFHYEVMVNSSEKSPLFIYYDEGEVKKNIEVHLKTDRVRGLESNELAIPKGCLGGVVEYQ